MFPRQWPGDDDDEDRAAVSAGAAGPGEPGAGVREPWGAGFTHRDATGGIGFADGGIWDRMDAGEALSRAAEQAWADGLDKLSDGELVGLMAAAHRNGARQAALKLAATSKLAARRDAPDGTPGEHVEDEVAALLTLTGRAAARQVALAAGMTRLPGTPNRARRHRAGLFALAIAGDSASARA
jgi:hypothetical protein